MPKYIVNTVLISVLLTIAGCNDSQDEVLVIPELEIYPAEAYEGSGEEYKAEVKIKLNKPSMERIIITWSTEGMSALPDIDFEEIINRESIIAPGETECILQVAILKDDHLEFSERFKIRIVQLVNAELKSAESIVIIIDNSRYIPDTREDGIITPITYPDMQLFWHDEFDDNSINEEYWNYDHPNGFPLNCGWASDETGKYTGDSEHLYIDNGLLTIRATVDPLTGIFRTSRINTNNKINIFNGRIDIRARIPETNGIASKFWMMGNDMDEVGWPLCGEIDITKHTGRLPGRISGGVVYDNGSKVQETQKQSPDVSGDISDKFHIYSLFWEKERIRWFIDYQPYLEINKKDFRDFSQFEKPYFFTINLAVGGEFAGYPDSLENFPHELQIDYIRIYQSEEDIKTGSEL